MPAPRIRSIKPEFWTDEKLAPLEDRHRLVFIGLWSLADDAGRLLDDVRDLNVKIFLRHPRKSVAKSLEVLERLGRIQRYQAENGQRVIQVVNFLKHQRIDKPKPSIYRDPPGSSTPAAMPSGTASPTRSSTASRTDLEGRGGGEGNDQERERAERVGDRGPAPGARSEEEPASTEEVRYWAARAKAAALGRGAEPEEEL